MSIIKLSEFLKWDIDPFILGVFYSRTLEESDSNKKYLYSYTEFKSSKYANHKKFDYDQYIKSDLIKDLNEISSPKMWMSYVDLKALGLKFPKRKAYVVLENDLDISLKSFFDKIYFKILNMDFVKDDAFNKGKADFIRGFIETRGSIDTKAKFISNDYYYNSPFELKKVRILTERMGVPSNVINLNFRNLQKQYREGKKRNPQLRINIHWYASNVGFVNKYKSYLYYLIYGNDKVAVSSTSLEFYSNKLNPSEETINTQFSKYLDLYSDHIYRKDLSKTDIERLRKEMNFVEVSKTNTTRNQSIIEIFRNLSEDICAGCGTTKTSTNKKTGRQNFEIHHYIPFSNDQSYLDNIDNLVKVCPTCHAALKKGRATKNEQIELCFSILEKNEPLYDFSSSYLGIEDMEQIAKKVQTLLK